MERTAILNDSPMPINSRIQCIGEHVFVSVAYITTWHHLDKLVGRALYPPADLPFARCAYPLLPIRAIRHWLTLCGRSGRGNGEKGVNNDMSGLCHVLWTCWHVIWGLVRCLVYTFTVASSGIRWKNNVCNYCVFYGLPNVSRLERDNETVEI